MKQTTHEEQQTTIQCAIQRCFTKKKTEQKLKFYRFTAKRLIDFDSNKLGARVNNVDIFVEIIFKAVSLAS